jgi:hypothetical protein
MILKIISPKILGEKIAVFVQNIAIYRKLGS